MATSIRERYMYGLIRLLLIMIEVCFLTVTRGKIMVRRAMAWSQVVM